MPDKKLPQEDIQIRDTRGFHDQVYRGRSRERVITAHASLINDLGSHLSEETLEKQGGGSESEAQESGGNGIRANIWIAMGRSSPLSWYNGGGVGGGRHSGGAGFPITGAFSPIL